MGGNEIETEVQPGRDLQAIAGRNPLGRKVIKPKLETTMCVSKDLKFFVIERKEVLLIPVDEIMNEVSFTVEKQNLKG